MADAPTIRETTPADIPGILALYPAMFPDEDLVPLVSDLLTGGVEIVSFAAFDGDAPVGHVLFTVFGTPSTPRAGALLGPLGVAPGFRRMGLGAALVKAGFTRLRTVGPGHVVVLGDPAYYARFGFTPERAVASPFPLPDDWAQAWRSVSLSPQASPPKGAMSLPEPWMRPALWMA